jgi:hypothetical protein
MASTIHNAAVHGQSLLLAIPPEIRLLIWKEVSRQVCVTVQCERDYFTKNVMFYYKYSLTDILLVNRLIYTESKTLLFENATLLARHNWCFLRSPSESRLWKTARKVEVLDDWINVLYAQRNSGFDVPGMVKLNFPALEHLTVETHVQHWRHNGMN